jgi:hypothetical protein
MAPEDKSRLRPVSSLRNLAPDSSTSSRWRFSRSTTNLREPEPRTIRPSQAPPKPTPAPAPKLERTPSKMSLFNLFSKPKVEKARGHVEVGLAVPMRPQSPSKSVSPGPPPKSALRQNPSPAAQQTIRSRSSQMFRPVSMRPVSSYKDTASWDPPPLFQAFPQSIKHATMQACVFAPEVLMRTQSQKRQAELLRDRIESSRDLSTISENPAEPARKLEKQHRRLISNAVLNPPAPELVNKIYILVTAGYVLQYAGEGTFDRLPEKVLKLGKDSAAFACDLIPGKHWVLQISSHAHDDGTSEPVPRHTILSRLRSQNTVTRKAATSFLLVLESAEEMDGWMTAVRKEIDSLGGMKVNHDEHIRSSSSTEDGSSKTSTETPTHRYQVHRDPSVVSKIGPVDSPLQSQYSGSPKITASDWETDPSGRTSSMGDSINSQTARHVHHRQSTDMSSVASTPVSQHQMQLDQLRGRSRFSYMSNTTSTSGPGTRNTSRDSSPAPHSPLMENFGKIGDAEPLRSAMSLKSFHMNPNHVNLASRRRSMQPLPITNEDLSGPTSVPPKRQRHSLYSPTSPTAPHLAGPVDLTAPIRVSKTPVPFSEKENAPVSVAGSDRTVHKFQPDRPAGAVPTREDSPVRFNYRSYSAPPRRSTISPPPNEPAPLPPPSAKRLSMVGTLSVVPSPTAPQTTSPDLRTQRRISATPKPFLRPFPVRPQAQHGNSAVALPRRQSSLNPGTLPKPLPLSVNVSRSVTAPARPPSATTSALPISHPAPMHSATPQESRRPISVQNRTEATTRPVRAIQSTPSFVPGRRSSTNPTSAPRPLLSNASIEALRSQALAQAHQYQQQLVEGKPGDVRPKTSALRFPPPAPPPTMPLPPPPPPASHISLPAPSPRMSLPTPPPNIPLPPTPNIPSLSAASSARRVVPA